MKNKLLILSIILLSSILFSCNSQKKSEEVAQYVYEEKVTSLSTEMQIKIGDWVEEDLVCYGLVVAIDDNGVSKFGKPVKAKIIKIDDNEIKMKALENVNIAPSKGCAKMGISRGQSWIEKEGDLFKTEVEAINYLKENKLYIE